MSAYQAWCMRLELLHVLQKERGCTSMWIASGGADFELAVKNLQTLVNEKISRGPPGICVEVLSQIRQMAHDGVQEHIMNGTSTGPLFYLVFARYTDLCEQTLELLCEKQAPAGSMLCRLKEDFGRERAFVGAILAFPDEASAMQLPSAACADYTLCLLHQSERWADIKTQHLHWFQHEPELNVLRKFSMESADPKLLQIHEYVHKTRDITAVVAMRMQLSRVHRSAAAWWDLMTDQLEGIHEALLASTEMQRALAAEKPEEALHTSAGITFDLLCREMYRDVLATVGIWILDGRKLADSVAMVLPIILTSAAMLQCYIETLLQRLVEASEQECESILNDITYSGAAPGQSINGLSVFPSWLHPCAVVIATRFSQERKADNRHALMFAYSRLSTHLSDAMTRSNFRLPRGCKKQQLQAMMADAIGNLDAHFRAGAAHENEHVAEAQVRQYRPL